ncbi:hypothetical protein [Paenibacillus senegalensis]|uniref:hypothetical protein n=1 Tax=Paenibacillus senegalensis TaxID=1465766 RepID=UPI00028A20F8|nr:hypothetical protein [Paenibacillus senegalensis]
MIKQIAKAITNKKLWVVLVTAVNIFLLLLIINKENGSSKNADAFPDGLEETYVGKVMLEDSFQAIPTGGFHEEEATVGAKTFHLYNTWEWADAFQDGEYEVHTYQLIEIYKDNQGNIVKRVPTENFNYLRYCPGCSVQGLPAD